MKTPGTFHTHNNIRRRALPGLYFATIEPPRMPRANSMHIICFLDVHADRLRVCRLLLYCCRVVLVLIFFPHSFRIPARRELKYIICAHDGCSGICRYRFAAGTPLSRRDRNRHKPCAHLDVRTYKSIEYLLSVLLLLLLL